MECNSLQSLHYKKFIQKYVDDYGNAFLQDVDPDHRVFDISDLEWVFEGQSIHYIACRIAYGDFHWDYPQFVFTDHGNIKSLSNWDVHEYLWDYIVQDLESFHEWLCQEAEDYETAFNAEFNLIEED